MNLTVVVFLAMALGAFVLSLLLRSPFMLGQALGYTSMAVILTIRLKEYEDE